jgi:hypothetical protein
MGSRKKIKCAHCGKRIRAHEPDLILRALDNGTRDHYYHNRCGGAAFSAAAANPTVYTLTVRHVEGALN